MSSPPPLIPLATYYETNTCATPTATCSHNQALDPYGSVAFMVVKKDVDYRISAGSSVSGLFNFTLTCDAADFPAPNDDCANAVSISQDTLIKYNASAATNLQFTISDVPPYRDVWFKTVATCTGAMTLAASGGYSQVRIQTSCTSNSYFGQVGPSQTQFVPVTAGTTYYFRAGSNTPVPLPTDEGSFRISCTAAPVNDKRAGALRITGEGMFSYDTRGAVYDTCQNDVWYIWSATCTGTAKVGACGLSGTYQSSYRLMTASGTTSPNFRLGHFLITSPQATLTRAASAP